MNEKSENSLEKVTTLRIKLITVFSILFAVAFAIISLVSYQVSKSFLIRDINLQTQEVVDGHAAEIDQWTARMFSVVNAYCRIIEEAIPEDKNITSKILKNYSRESFFSDMYYGSVTGRFISGKKWSPPAGYDPRQRPWYMSAVKNRKTSIADLYLDFESQGLAVSVSSPVYNSNGSLRGVLSADLLLITIEEKLKNVRVKGKGHPLLIDSQGTALLHPDKALLGRNLTGDPIYGELIKNIIIKKRGEISHDSGRKRFTIFTQIPSSGWIFGIILTEDEIYSDLKWLAMKFYVLFLISLIIVILTTKYFAVKLTYFMSLLEQTVEARTSELKEKVAEVEYLSLTDHLTGIANRRKIESVLKSEIERSSRTGSPLSVIMVDIDFFKKFNDTLGHETGDMVLKNFAETLVRSIRTIDLAGRLGGEEFLIICPETSLPGAILAAEKLRTAVESMKNIPIQHITASFGCATFIPGEDWNSLISRSDKALYIAKEHGRNRVEVYN